MSEPEENKKPKPVDELTIMRSAKNLMEKVDVDTARRVLTWVNDWNNGRGEGRYVGSDIQDPEDARQPALFGKG